MRGFWPWADGTKSTVVGGYRLLGELGSGGFSTVELAEDLAARRRVALKVARVHTRQTQEKFAAEAAIGERLASAKGIVGTLTLTRTKDGRPVLVMPYYDQGTAADLLPEQRRLPLTGVIDLVRQVAQGLDAMHRQHYLHRDVSPRNILRSTELGAALGDLGCARPVNSVAQSARTEALTPGYAAPEATAGNAVQTIASDVYGLAATTWALLTGEPPHGRPPDPAALHLLARYELRRTTQPPPVERLRAARVPNQVADLLVTALDPDPSRRPARVLDFSEALAAAVTTIPVTGPATGDSTNPATKPSTNPATNPTVGPLRPSGTLGQSTVEATELVGDPARTRSHGDVVPTRGASGEAPGRGRRRLVSIAVVAASFVLAFLVVRIVTGAGAPSNPGPSRTPTATAKTSPSGPLNTLAVAPQDLAITKDTGQSLTLTWTPPTAPDAADALSVLYRSTATGAWQRQDATVYLTRGRLHLQVSSPRERYCFRLVVLVRASPGVNSNTACTARDPAA